MKISKKLKVVLKYLIPTVIVMVGVPLLQRTTSRREPFEKDTLRCVIGIKNSPSMRYAVGYNYEMLQLFAWQLGKNTDIMLGGKEYIDSLKNGVVDIVVMPFDDSLIFDQSVFASIPLADSSSWLVHGRLRPEHYEVNHWLSTFNITDEHKIIKGRFSPGYEPYRRLRKGWTYRTLSPYDDLIRKYSAELGWDRTMLTALIWQESQFHIEAQSRRGAVGLMQLMPRTADSFQADNLLDPEVSIRTAVTYLKHLQNMFRPYTSDRQELMKFTLAAYNAGEGRIKDCMNYAASIGAPHSRWEDIVAVIPDMREDSILEADTVKLGKFQGYETINYVKKLTDLSRTFAAISGTKSSFSSGTTGHAPSSPDPRPTRKDTAAAETASSPDKK